MIEFAGVTKRIEGRLVLDDVTFRALPGEVTALVGPAGCGKSVLLRCLCGLATPTEGVVTVQGSRPEEMSVPGRTVAVAFDTTSLHPGRSARETLVLATLMTRMPYRRADEVLQLIGLPRRSGRVGSFTADQKARLAIGVAMVGVPAGLALDEPLVGLDPSSREWFADLVQDHARRGGAVLVTASNAGEVEGLAEHVVEMDAGRVAADYRTDGSAGAVAPALPSRDVRDLAVSPDAAARILGMMNSHAGPSVGRES